MKQTVQVSEIAEKFAGLKLISSYLGGDVVIQNISAADSCGPGDLTFVSSIEYLDKARQRQPAAVVISEDLAEALANEKELGVLVTNNVKLAHALIKQEFADRDFLDDQWPKIHPSAVIHDSVKIPESCFIGPHVVIGQDARLGERNRLLAGVVVENGVSIGDDCIFHPNCVIGYNCQIGNHVEIGSCSVIGSEGYGFAQDKERKSYKIPQTGIVVIEDNVLLGACNTIDRATYDETRIGAGTKTDNIIHIAHNVDVGEDCLFTPMLAVAGSSKIGDRMITSGQTEISDHINICNDVVLLHRAGVVKDITKPGMYAGLPTMPLKQHIKSTVHIKNLDALKKQVMDLEKRVEKLSEK